VNWKTPITLSVLVVVLVGAAYYGWQAVIAPPEGNTTAVTPTEPTKPTKPTKPTPTCKKVTERPKTQRVDSKDVLVNVYNAGSISGLATETLTTLEGKDFRGGVAEDAPAGATATNVTILTKDRSAPEVRLVALQFNGKITYSDGDVGPGVDIVVGDQFESINPIRPRFLEVKQEAVTTCKRETTPAP
jgi:cytoskeletal protein RodZ